MSDLGFDRVIIFGPMERAISCPSVHVHQVVKLLRQKYERVHVYDIVLSKRDPAYVPTPKL
jgi:hypothetical protein